MTIKVGRGLVTTLIVLVLVGLLFWATRPLWHWIVMAFYLNPVVTGLLVLGTLIAIAGVRRDDYGIAGIGTGAGALAGITLLASFVLFLVSDAIAHSNMAGQMEPEITTTFLETARVRYVPIEVAETLARNKQEDSRLQIGDVDPIDFNGEFLWVTPLVPNGFVNSFVHQMSGFLVVNEDEEVAVVKQPFRYGEGMLLWHHIGWQLLSRRYLVEYPEIFYLPVEEDGSYLGVAPYIGYQFRFPVMVPYWAGVMVFHGDGTIEDLTSQQAMDDQRFTGQRLFPEWLARYQAESWAYKNGILNAWFTHADQVEIPNLAHSENQMPYLLPGNIWMTAAEPMGPSYSIFKIFFHDAHTGELQLYEVGEEKGSLGPNVAWGYAKAQTQAGYVWAEEGEGGSGTYLLIEPRPAINNEGLWWMYTVTTREETGIALTILVKSEDEVLHFCSKASLDRWLKGQGGSDSIPCGQSTQPTPQTPEVPADDLSKLSDEQLLELLRRIADELERRR